MKYSMGSHEIDSEQVGELRDSSTLLLDKDFEGLRGRMTEDGYLLLRGLQSPEKVVAVRDYLLEQLSANEQIDLDHPLEEGYIKAGARGGFMGGSKNLTRTPVFLDLVESPEIMGFFAEFLRSDVLTFDFKWLRVVGKGDNTGAHYDVVYMGRGTQNLYTVWTPITEVTSTMGPLAILAGSHRGEGFERVRETYGKMDVDRDRVTGYFSNDPYEMIEKFGGQWQTSEFAPGDVLIFGMYTMHASFNNTGDRFRISCDTRYQRASDPVDERWVGENPPAHYGWHSGETVTMETAREGWEV
ncbi:MAG: phytanoyl-CoA dioxygenase family protein [Chthonomonadaceae bacterium]|nr:phytanoyl-CoA dioxygenase family protein [Chthonomonadaceae bacterium]